MLLHSKILGDSQNHILILHGFLGSGDNWISIARKLNFEGYTVHLIDQRNHGRSYHTENFDYQLMSNDLLKYIEYYKIKDPILIGHSMGGKTVMKFSLEFPKLVQKLFVLDISPKEYPTHHQSIMDSLESLDFNSLNTRKEINNKLKKSIEQSALRNFLLKNIYRKDNKRFDFRFNLKSLSKNINKIGEKVDSAEKFNGEAYFFKGSRSEYIMHSDQELIHKLFPKSKFIIIQNAGHWLHVDNPNDFLSELLSLI
tara:strand:- start:872 stop:1636 length:765 start_codon:yes stop_codon:yes gene_type:complete